MADIKKLVRSDFLRLEHDSTVAKLLGSLKDKDYRNAFIFKGGKFKGIVNRLSLLKSKISINDMKAEALALPVPIISPEADTLYAAYLMFNTNTEILPVGNDMEVTGLLHILDLIGTVEEYEEINKLRIKDLKIEGNGHVNTDDGVSKVIQLVRELKTNEIPVIENGRLAGIISITDIINKYTGVFPINKKKGIRGSAGRHARGFEAEKQHMADLPVKNFDTRDVQSLGLNYDVKKAAAVMKSKNIMSIVVMDNNELKGVLTAHNILRAIASLYKVPDKNIIIEGIKKTKLDETQSAAVNELISREAEKLEHYYKNDFKLKIHIKSYQQSGGREKYSVAMSLLGAGPAITSDVHDWDINTVLHKGFKSLMSQLKSKFKGRNEPVPRRAA